MPSQHTTGNEMCVKPSKKRDELRVFSRHKYFQEKEVRSLKQSQESEPIENQNPHESSNLPLKSSFLESESLEIPIALRKYVCTCTKHPLSNFMSYDRLSSSFHVFVSQLSSIEIPRYVQEALDVPEWKEANFEKMRALDKNRTREMVGLPEERILWGVNGYSPSNTTWIGC